MSYMMGGHIERRLPADVRSTHSMLPLTKDGVESELAAEMQLSADTTPLSTMLDERQSLRTEAKSVWRRDLIVGDSG
jgi:hypothetical protein